MADIVVRVGNTAPTTSARRPATPEEIEAGGPLLSKEGDDYLFLDKTAVGDQAITTFVIPHAASVVNAVKDVGLAFTSQHSNGPAAWVHADDDHMIGALLAQHLGSMHGVDVPHLLGADVEAFLNPQPETISGGAIQAIGRDEWAQALADYSGTAGTFTGTSATTGTNSGASWTSNQWAGKDVIAAGTTIATILSNTSTALTVARWETPGSRSGSAASTPGSTSSYVIASGQTPAAWVALTANSGSPSTGGSDTTLTGEIATSGGGLVRATAVYGHTTGTNTYTLTNTFTANGSDSLPVTIAKIGVFQAQNGGRLLFETLLGSTATLNNSGDNVQVTDTITGT